MNLQDIFDKVVTHLRKQGKKALNEEGSCVYKASDGRMCAVGVLIPPDKYREYFEGTGFESFIDGIATREAWTEELIPFKHQISDLRKIHDNFPVDVWEEKFQEFANLYILQFQKA